MSQVDEIILQEYGVDTAELAKQYSDIIVSRVADEHMEAIEALAALIAISHHRNDAAGYMAAAITLFAVGYKAGKNASYFAT